LSGCISLDPQKKQPALPSLAYDVRLNVEVAVTTMIALDDDLVAKAGLLTGLNESSALVREALKALIERESGRRSPGSMRFLHRTAPHSAAQFSTEDFG
jgi:Arc/MetJ family transcription regulator